MHTLLFNYYIFLSGAILGTRTTNVMVEKAILICLLPMIISLCIMFKGMS